MNIIPYVFDTVLSTLVTSSYEILAMVPHLLGAALLLLVGLFLARGIRFVVEYGLDHFKADHLLAKAEVDEVLHRLGLGRSPTKVAAFCAYWFVLAAFLLSSAEVAQLTAVNEFKGQVLAFMPRLIAAVVVFGGGLFLGRFFEHIVHGAAAANDFADAPLLGRATYVAMAVFSGMMALKQLGIDPAMIMSYPHIVVSAIGFGIALAFGLSVGMGRPSPLMKPGRKVDLHVVKAKSA